jgi:putative flavoprotein involved in K+ transport
MSTARKTTKPESVDVLIVGAGHAGLAMSGLLTHEGREHVVVERRQTLGGGWQDRWDEFTLVTPNWTASFPGWAYDGNDPHGFMSRDEIAARVARYAEVVRAPVGLGTEVHRLVRTGDKRFRVTTSRGALSARQVVVATGSYHRPRVPEWASSISGRVTQLHAHEYRNQAGLPEGGVLVVGSGQTGLQLAEELHEAGRPVYISVGSAGRIPRRYRGRDIFSWLTDIIRGGAAVGVTLPTAGQLPDPRRRFNPMPALTGRNGGHDTNLRRYAADGTALAGRLIGADHELLTFAGDLHVNLERADHFFDERFRGVIDSYIERSAIEAPPPEDGLVRGLIHASPEFRDPVRVDDRQRSIPRVLAERGVLAKQELAEQEEALVVNPYGGLDLKALVSERGVLRVVGCAERVDILVTSPCEELLLAPMPVDLPETVVA